MGRFRQPVRDERWTDPQGEEWQVREVRVIKPSDSLPKRVAYVVFAKLDGTTMKVRDLEGWRPRGRDPLAGRRSELSDAIRDGATVLVFPPSPEPPVAKGEVYHLASGRILIDKVSANLVRGQKERDWHVEFIRLMKDRVYLLRTIVPGARPDELVKPPTADDIKRARIDGNYTSSPIQSKGTDRGESPDPDWKDKRMAERELERQKARAERMTVDRIDAEVDKAAARLKQVGRTLGRNGHDLTGLLADVYERLAAEEREAA